MPAKFARSLAIAGSTAADGNRCSTRRRERGAIAGLKKPDNFQSGALRVLDREVDYPAGVGVGVADVGIEIVWPACNLRPSSMWFAFCNSSTVTLYIFAMDVSVSPRATVCTLPAAGWDEDAPGATEPACAGVLSPIMTPGRMCETCCSSLRIS